MIQELREYSQSFLFKLLLGVICVTFVVSFGVGSFGDRKEVIAKVNGREILLKDYRKAYQNRLQSLRQQFGENADAFAEQINLRQRVFEQMIDQELLAIEAENMNLEATDLELQEEIRNQPYFQKDGNFDFETYNTVLSQNRIVRQEYEDSLREELKVRKLQKLIGVGLLVSSNEVDEMYQLENQKIQIGYLHFDPQVFIPGVEIKDGEVRQYFEENRDAFKTEKAYRIESFVLGLQDFQEEVKVKEREIRRYYEKNLETYTTPPKVKARHILFKVDPDAEEEQLQQRREELQQLLDEIRQGGDFEALAKTKSEDATAEKGGDLGWFQPGEMVPAFEDAAFRLAIGEVSDIVQSPFGLHLIRVDEREEQVEKDLEEVREEITALLTEKRSEKKLNEELTRIEAVIPDKELSKVADEFSKSIESSEAFSRNDLIPGLGSAYGLVSELEAKESGEKGIWKRNSLQGHVIYQLVEIKEPVRQEFEEVQEAAREALKLKRAGEMARVKAGQALSQAKAGTTMEDLASENGLQAQTFEFTAMTQYLPQLGQNETFRKTALSLTESNPYALSDDEDRVDLIQLQGKRMEDADPETLKQQIRLRLRQQLQQSVLTKELERLRDTADVEIINPVFQQYQQTGRVFSNKPGKPHPRSSITERWKPSWFLRFDLFAAFSSKPLEFRKKSAFWIAERVLFESGFFRIRIPFRSS